MSSRLPLRTSHRLALPALTALAVLLLAGCFTGKRPHFEDDNPLDPGSMTGDLAIDAVLTRFDALTDSPVSAAYDVLTKFGNAPHTAVVALEGSNRSVTIDTVHYIQNADGAFTCTTDASQPCAEGWDLARISDTLLTTDFYAADAAKRLRRDAQASLAPGTATEETIAGMPAVCVQVQVPGGTAKYCALADGLAALVDDGDLRITMTLHFDTVDPASFTAA